jgi:hypothetical protein
MHAIPEQLRGRPFTTAEAEDAGVSARSLQGARFTAIHRGVWRTADTEPTLDVLLAAARLVLPADAAVSHLTNLRLRGLDIGALLPLHFSTNHRHEIQRAGLVVHRRQGLLRPSLVKDTVALGARQTFVDSATRLDDRRLLAVGDWLVHTGQVDLLELRAYVLESHLDGVRRARRVAPHVREGSASVRESDVRWALVRAGLPSPELNIDIVDDHGQWLARGDLVYRRWKVLVEYDGWQHERDAVQRQRDHLRREALEAAGWRVIVITTADMASPRSVVYRVLQALRQRGFSL